MIKVKIISITIFIVMSMVSLFAPKKIEKRTVSFSNDIPICIEEKGCVFRTIFGEEKGDSSFIYNTPEEVKRSIKNGLIWLSKSQLSNGGWGAGSHFNQHQFDPLSVNADPATTATVAMALMRTGNTLQSGQYSQQLKGAIEFLLLAVENTDDNQLKITQEENTQIQTKLGDNIDAIMTAQSLSNLLDILKKNDPYTQRVQKALDKCVDKIQRLQAQDGSIKGDGWAGVLQSSLANNALESAQKKGANVDDVILNKSRDYQKGNYDANTGSVNTEKGAGIILYAVTGSARATAKQARRVKEAYEKGVASGMVEEKDEINRDMLLELGFDEQEAEDYYDSYKVYESSKNKAQEDQVLNGFGNNGGEEFLSYLQTGESLIINKDESWKNWYTNMSGRLVSIQNNDGSWNGHHCITSPVFCTATTLLILSINNDLENLIAQGEE